MQFYEKIKDYIAAYKLKTVRGCRHIYVSVRYHYPIQIGLESRTFHSLYYLTCYTKYSTLAHFKHWHTGMVIASVISSMSLHCTLHWDVTCVTVFQVSCTSLFYCFQ